MIQIHESAFLRTWLDVKKQVIYSTWKDSTEITDENYLLNIHLQCEAVSAGFSDVKRFISDRSLLKLNLNPESELISTELMAGLLLKNKAEKLAFVLPTNILDIMAVMQSAASLYKKVDHLLQIQVFTTQESAENWLLETGV